MAAAVSSTSAPVAVAAASKAVPILGDLLNGLFDQVNDQIQRALNAAQDAGSALLIQAGREVAIAIENARNAYQSSLQYTVDKLDKSINQHVSDLQSMLQKLQQGTADSLKDLEQNATQLVLALPFSSKQTQLRTVMPHYVVASNGQPSVRFTFEGVFYWSATKGFEPKLTFGNTQYSPVATTTNSLTFEVPVSAIIVDQGAALNKCTFAVGTLSAPWDNGWVFSSRAESTYKVLVGALPLSPGKIDVELTAQRTERVTKQFISAQTQAWGDDAYPRNWVTKEFRFPLDAGWTVLPGTQRLEVLQGAHGSHKETISVEGGNTLVVKVELCAKSGKLMGRIDFKAHCTQYQDVTQLDKRVKPIVLKWGDSVVVEPNQGEAVSKITFDSFDGVHSEFAGPSLDNPYLAVASQNGKYVLTATVPKQIMLGNKVVFKA